MARGYFYCGTARFLRLENKNILSYKNCWEEFKNKWMMILLLRCPIPQATKMRLSPVQTKHFREWAKAFRTKGNGLKYMSLIRSLPSNPSEPYLPSCATNLSRLSTAPALLGSVYLSSPSLTNVKDTAQVHGCLFPPQGLWPLHSHVNQFK